MENFKVGDWVICNIEPFKITNINNGIINSHCEIKECVLWQPKEGEWCWFKDEKNTIGSLTQLLGIEKDGTYYGYSSCGIPDKAPCVEPFIGELPTFLQH